LSFVAGHQAEKNKIKREGALEERNIKNPEEFEEVVRDSRQINGNKSATRKLQRKSRTVPPFTE
jgi:hypothetical protein